MKWSIDKYNEFQWALSDLYFDSIMFIWFIYMIWVSVEIMHKKVMLVDKEGKKSWSEKTKKQ